MEKYKNQYRIGSARAQWWDYGCNAAYFITICTRERASYLGHVADGAMTLSPLGVIADVLWHCIPHHSPHVILGDFVVMPNHLHGILIFNSPENEEVATPTVETGHALSVDDTPLHANPQHELPNLGQSRFQHIGNHSLPSIIAAYKSAVTKHANRLGYENGWQTRYHDHIIRNEEDFQRISAYIVENPLHWMEDKFYTV